MDQEKQICDECGYAIPWSRVPQLFLCQKTGRTKRPGSECDVGMGKAPHCPATTTSGILIPTLKAGKPVEVGKLVPCPPAAPNTPHRYTSIRGDV